MKFIMMLWAYIPSPARIWVGITLAVLVAGMMAGLYYKIYARGYNRCEGQYAAGALALKDAARKDILELEDKYEEIKSKIIKTEGDNAVCGPRVVYAIDRMPSGASDGK